MISLKIKNYTKEEKQKLLIIFESALRNLATTLCYTASCDDCPNKKVCRDISLAVTYLVNNQSTEE